jgi:hypothetical protein
MANQRLFVHWNQAGSPFGLAICGAFQVGTCTSREPVVNPVRCDRFIQVAERGEMAEWLKAHAWKACIPQGIQGSNPCLSAIPFNSITYRIEIVWGVHVSMDATFVRLFPCFT